MFKAAIGFIIMFAWSYYVQSDSSAMMDTCQLTHSHDVCFQEIFK